MTSQKHFHIRLTADIENNRYAQYAVERTTKHILVRENADEDCKQTHLHIHFESLHSNDQSLRREFKKWFSALSGNKDYSLKQGDELGYVYVCKGTDSDWEIGKPTVLSTTFSEDEIKEFHRRYWNHKSRVVVKLSETAEPPEPKKKKTRAPSWTERVTEEIRTNYPDKKWNLDLETDKISLCDKILDRMGDSGKALDEIIFRRIFYAVYNGLKHQMTNETKTEFRQKFYRCLDK